MRRPLIAALVLLLGLGFLAATHGYLALRLVLEPGWPEPWRSGGVALLGVLALLLVLQPLGERWLRPPASRLLAWPASLWMGLAFWLLLALPLSDALLWLLEDSAAAADGAGGAAARAALVLGLAGAAAVVALPQGLRPPRHLRHEIVLARWPAALDGFRVVQISDLHIGPILGRNFAARICARVVALAPDLIAVTGDLVDGNAERLRQEVEPLEGLRAPHGVFFVTGNHDHYSGADSWVARVGELGMRVLRNERVAIEAHGAVFDLVGVDDAHGSLFGGAGGEDLDAALAGRDAERPALLLAHDPSTFKRAAGRGIDLQLSGHTHGGQIWPFKHFVRLVVPFVAGHYRRGDAQLYVSRGTGFWGPPMRLGAPAEITEIVLRSAPS